MKKKINLFCVSLCLLPFLMNAQQTGSFTAQVNVNGTNTNVAFYVPSDYNAANFYPLVVAMHPGGSDGTSMRSLIISAATALNLILACPDHTGSNDGTIAAVINYVKKNYTVNATKIILTGYSMGGNPVFEYGFAYPNKVAGIIGIAPAVWNYSSYNYSITKNFPVAIIVGSEDDFITEIREIKSNIENQDGKLKYIEKPGVQHMDPYFQSADFTTDWISCYDFIKDTINSVVPENQSELEIRLLKNPVKEYLEIEFPAFSGFKTGIKIYSVTGQVVYDEIFILNYEQKTIILLPTGEFQPGIYLLKACIKGSYKTVKFNVIK